MNAELHIHTTASDGVLTVEEILKIVNKKRDYIAITDHDIIDSSVKAYALTRGDEYHVKSIIGVEISSINKDESVHVLGYFNDYHYLDKINKTLKTIRDNRRNRVYKMNELLNEHFGINLELDELLKLNSITRGSIAREIIRQGYNYTNEEIFKNMIGVGCPAYIKASKIGTGEAVDVIHECHGLAVLAHPTLLKKQTAEDLLVYGFDGIEAVYPRNKAGDEDHYRNLALSNNMFVTGGADFHDFHDPNHADLLTIGIENKDLEVFLNRLNNLK